MVVGGHVWLLGRECVWLPGGVHGYQGVCMVARGCVWLPGGMRGCQGAAWDTTRYGQ